MLWCCLLSIIYKISSSAFHKNLIPAHRVTHNSLPWAACTEGGQGRWNEGTGVQKGIVQRDSGNTVARATVFGCTTRGLSLWPTEPLKDTQQNITEIPPQMPVSCICGQQCSTDQMLFPCRVTSEKIMWSSNVTQKHPFSPGLAAKELAHGYRELASCRTRRHFKWGNLLCCNR